MPLKDVKLKIIVLSVLFLLLGCAAEKKTVLPIDIRYASVFLDTVVNNSQINALPNWPIDSLQNRVLMETFTEIAARFSKEVGKYSGKGGYALTDRKDMADYIIGFTYLPVVYRNDSLRMPVIVKTENRKTGKIQEKRFEGFGGYPHGKDTRSDRFHYHYYGVLLAQVGRMFPVDSMGMLFYPHEQNSY